ncbi:MAG: WhiB family transcriptional regulator [Phycicoccus sp.]
MSRPDGVANPLDERGVGLRTPRRLVGSTPGGARQPVAALLAELAALAQAQPWRAEALCPQVDTDLFFPEVGRGHERARQVCALCPVARECAEHAVATGEEHGVWGGTTPNDRARLGHPVQST